MIYYHYCHCYTYIYYLKFSFNIKYSICKRFNKTEFFIKMSFTFKIIPIQFLKLLKKKENYNFPNTIRYLSLYIATAVRVRFEIQDRTPHPSYHLTLNDIEMHFHQIWRAISEEEHTFSIIPNFYSVCECCCFNFPTYKTKKSKEPPK